METKMCSMSLCANFMLPKDIANLNHPLERKGSDETNHLIQVIKLKLGINNNKGLPLEMSTFKLFTVANLHY